MRIFVAFVFCAVLVNAVKSQTAMHLGLNAGTTVSWPADISQLSDEFFTVSRAGFQGGIINTLTISDRLILSLGVNASLQSFALRQTGEAAYNLDARFKAFQLDVPFQVGFTGYLGSLRHRALLGVGLQTNLSYSNKLVFNGDSSSTINLEAISTGSLSVYPVLNAAFEIGSEFNNDAALFFGICFRYGLQEAYSATLNSTRYIPQTVTYNGTYLGFGLTYYLPRYSYWFKREFIY